MTEGASPKPVTGKPKRYCLGCWYILDGLSEHQCPECGRLFDPSRPRTFADRPRDLWWLRWIVRNMVRLAIVVLVVALWFFWMHNKEQRVAARIVQHGGTVEMQDLDLRNWPIDNWQPRDNLPFIETIRVVDLRQAPNTSDDDLAHFQSLWNLRVLRLGKTAITDDGIEFILGHYRLRRLDLDKTAITDAGIEKLSVLTRMKYLHLASTKITDDGLKVIGTLTDLTELDLSDTRITDAGLKHLIGLPHLRRLWLDGTDITEAGLTHLQAMPSIEQISLTNTAVTQERADAAAVTIPTLMHPIDARRSPQPPMDED